ncbi:MAG: hypothetical protein JST92_05890, partial [Deltaproteobacteria bacterium]|nr:hypothetical protein [Deltaproteobacteria bacterium]
MRPDLCQRSTWVALLFALLVCAQMAEAAEATCRATRIGPGARVSIVLDELLDPDLYRLVRLGMRGRITLELKVVRRGFLFGRTLSRTEVQTSLIWSEG